MVSSMGLHSEQCMAMIRDARRIDPAARPLIIAGGPHAVYQPYDLFGSDPWTLGGAARHRLRARLFLAPQTPPLPPRQRVVNAVLAARLPHWSLWQAFASLLTPAEGSR